MVGIPKSQGCLECIRSRVKCDATKPGCFRCQLTHKTCPGYDRPVKFINWSLNGARASHRTASTFSNERRKRIRAKTSGAQVEQDPINKIPFPYSIHTSIIEYEQAFGLFIDDALPYDRYSSGIQFMRHWLSSITKRWEQSRPLADAVRAIALHYLGRRNNEQVLINYGREKYGSALKNLQRAINHQGESRANETMSATMLLSLYEVFACTREDAWIQHAQGVACMIQFRGPPGLQDNMSGFDLGTMFRAFRGQLIMESFVLRRPCFIQDQKWQRRDGYTSIQGLLDEFYEYLAEFPGLIIESARLQQEKQKTAAMDDLSHRAIYLNTQLDFWFKRLQNVVGIIPMICANQQSITAHWEAFDFKSIYITSIFCYYCACRVMLNRLLARFAPWVEVKLRISTNTYVDMIHVISSRVSFGGFLEQYYFTFPLQIGTLLATTDDRRSRARKIKEKMEVSIREMVLPQE